MDKIYIYLKSLFSYHKDAPMLFNSIDFLVLFSVFLLIYALIYKKSVPRILFTLAFSLFFYFKASEKYVLILLFSIVIDYFLGFAIHQASKKSLKLVWLWVSIIINVGLLFYFKYTNFFIDNINQISGSQITFQKIILPIGISFYTFQTLSYVIDIYRGILSPIKNLWDYAFYMSFFPHLVAGPIVRAKDFLPQIHQKIDYEKQKANIGIAFYLICKGLIKKAIFSDYISQYGDIVYGSPEGFSGFEHLMAMYGYALQIYLDFSGYSDMAIGIAKLLGYELGENFNSPYQSISITEFWRRWHISLSSWLRDYIYIPLGGNRYGTFRQYFNLIFTMLVGGFWHGANWKFIFWGGFHGLGLAFHKLLSGFTKGKLSFENFFQLKIIKIISGILTFHFVAILWIYFRAGTFKEANYSIYSIFNRMDLDFVSPFLNARGLFVFILILGFTLHLIPIPIKSRFGKWFGETPFYVKTLILLVIIQFILQLRTEAVQPFIYFQF